MSGLVRIILVRIILAVCTAVSMTEAAACAHRSMATWVSGWRGLPTRRYFNHSLCHQVEAFFGLFLCRAEI
jgi:hypothetical protein